MSLGFVPYNFARWVAGLKATPNRNAVTFSGVGSLFVNAISKQQAQIAFAGAGSLSFNTLFKQQAISRFLGTGFFSSIPVVPNAARFTSAVIASASFDAPVVSPAVATFAGAGSLTINTLSNQQIIVTFSARGTGEFFLNAYLTESIPESFAPSGSLFAKAFWGQSVSASFGGTGGFAPAAFLGQAATVTFSGAGSLSTNAFSAQAAQVTFAGAGSLTAFAVAVPQATAWPGEIRFAGAGSLLANTQSLQQAVAIFNGAGALSSFAVSVHQLAATFAGTGLFTATPVVNLAASVSFQGAGSLAVPAENIKFVSTLFAGAGSLMLTPNFKAQMAFVHFVSSLDLNLATVMKATVYTAFEGAGDFNAYANTNSRVTATFQGMGSFLAAAVDLESFISVHFAGTCSFFSDCINTLPVIVVQDELALIANQTAVERFIDSDIATKNNRYLYLGYGQIISGRPSVIFSGPRALQIFTDPPKAEIGTRDVMTSKGLFPANTYVKCELDITGLLHGAGVWSVSAYTVDSPSELFTSDSTSQNFYMKVED